MSSTLGQDSFTDTNGDDLVTSHTPEVGTWVNWGGSILVQSNKAQVNTDGTYVILSNSPDSTVTCKITCGAANANFAPSIVVRGRDSTHYDFVYFSGDGNLQYYRRNGGTFTALYSTTWSANTSEHTVIVAVDANVITTTIDGGTPWVVTLTGDENIFAGSRYFGIRGFRVSGNADKFDDFLVTTDIQTFPYPYDSTPAFSDDFTGTNGQQLSARGFTEYSGDWEIDTNAAEQQSTSTGGDGAIVVKDIATGEVAIEVTITTSSSSYALAGVCLRAQDSGHFVEIELNGRPAYSGNQGFGIWYLNGAGGAYQHVASAYFVPASSTTYTLRITAVGTRIRAEIVEADLHISGNTSQFQSETKHGMFTFTGGSPSSPQDNKFDGLKIYTESTGSDGSASGIGSAAGVGESTAAASGSASGIGAAAASSLSILESVGSASGTSTASAEGMTLGSIGSSAGVSGASGVGASDVAGAGNAAGTGAASGVGQIIIGASGSAAGIGSASAVGGPIIAVGGSAIGTSVVSAEGASTVIVSGNASGVSSAAGVGISINEIVGASDSVSSVTAVAIAIYNGVGVVTGIAGAVGVGASDAAANGSSLGAVGSANGVGASTYGAVGEAAGASAASGSGTPIVHVVGSASGTGFANGVSNIGVGLSSGTSTVLGVSPVFHGIAISLAELPATEITVGLAPVTSIATNDFVVTDIWRDAA